MSSFRRRTVFVFGAVLLAIVAGFALTTGMQSTLRLPGSGSSSIGGSGGSGAVVYPLPAWLAQGSSGSSSGGGGGGGKSSSSGSSKPPLRTPPPKLGMTVEEANRKYFRTDPTAADLTAMKRELVEDVTKRANGQRTKIGVLIPVISSSAEANPQDLILLQVFLPSFLDTIEPESHSPPFEYTVFLGYNTGDRLYSNPVFVEALKAEFAKAVDGYAITMQLRAFDVPLGNPVAVWNHLALMARDAGMDYLYQTGDDIRFRTKDWPYYFVYLLSRKPPPHANFGVVGPTDVGMSRILTQSFVHRTHVDIFGFYFPPAFKNWFCDDWMTEVYAPDHMHMLPYVQISNTNIKGTRYVVDHAKALLQPEVDGGKERMAIWLAEHTLPFTDSPTMVAETFAPTTSPTVATTAASIKRRDAIAMMIPVICTTERSPGETDLLSIFVPSFIETVDANSPDFEYWFMLGFNKGDRCYDRNVNEAFVQGLRAEFASRLSAFPAHLQLHGFDVEKGNVVAVWNNLAQLAFDQGADFLYQLGDDVKFETPGWAPTFVRHLRDRKLFGVVGPMDTRNTRILTQSFVHRTHFAIFGYYMPPAFKNWFCDDWMSEVYKPHHMAMLRSVAVFNSNGHGTRYEVVQAGHILNHWLEVGRGILDKWLQAHPVT